jgi:hypothetical protein
MAGGIASIQAACKFFVLCLCDYLDMFQDIQKFGFLYDLCEIIGRGCWLALRKPS